MHLCILNPPGLEIRRPVLASIESIDLASFDGFTSVFFYLPLIALLLISSIDPVIVLNSTPAFFCSIRHESCWVTKIYDTDSLKRISNCGLAGVKLQDCLID